MPARATRASAMPVGSRYDPETERPPSLYRQVSGRASGLAIIRRDGESSGPPLQIRPPQDADCSARAGANSQARASCATHHHHRRGNRRPEQWRDMPCLQEGHAPEDPMSARGVQRSKRNRPPRAKRGKAKSPGHNRSTRIYNYKKKRAERRK